MSKAIEGVALLAGAVAVGATEFALASTGVGLAALPILTHVMASLVMGGIAMEAGAVASALTSNRGMDITTRQAAGARQIVYGMQRIGGNLIYPSTTGSSKDQYNRVIVLAGHPLWAIQSLYLDGRLVYFDVGSVGNVTQNGINFGGNANGNTYTGPNGVQYNFGGGPGGTHVFCSPHFGDQVSGDVDEHLTANDPNWAADASGSPYVGGCTYVYLKLEYSTSIFPSDPEIKFTVFGKPVYDPRTGETVYSSNAALICADWASDPIDGLGLIVNQAQLIAAANICDEQVACAQGMEARYACHHHFDTSATPSDIFMTLLKSMGGRSSMIGGELYLFPAYWQGPSFSWDEGILTAGMQWDSTASYKDSCNRVTGTYTAANFPYNIAGNFYDSNGFADGQIQNNFQFGFTPDNFPQYACDPMHGFAADEWLNRDSGVTGAWSAGQSFALDQIVSYTRIIANVPYASAWRSLIANNTGNIPGPTSTFWVNAAQLLPMEVSYNMVLSISQAQRLAKIDMMRRRFWGEGTFEMGLAALAMQDIDVFNMSSKGLGWTDKTLEVIEMTFKTITRETKPGDPPSPPEYRLSVKAHETDPSIYDWSPEEERDIYGVPTLPQQQDTAAAPPTDLALVSGAAEALLSPDGVSTPRLEVTWSTPLDGFVTQIQIQYRQTGATDWINGPLVDVSLNSGYVSPIVSGQQYDVRIRSLRPNGAMSAWVEIDAFTTSVTLSSISSEGLNPNSPYNISNNATVDSIVESAAATIRIYGPGGDGSSFVRYVGATPITMSAAHVTGEAFTTSYYIVYDSIGLAYLALTDYNDTLADQYVFIGAVVTCAATYTGGGTGSGSGGSTGGGGISAGGGRQPITVTQQLAA